MQRREFSISAAAATSAAGFPLAAHARRLKDGSDYLTLTSAPVDTTGRSRWWSSSGTAARTCNSFESQLDAWPKNHAQRRDSRVINDCLRPDFEAAAPVLRARRLGKVDELHKKVFTPFTH
jgi:hypothetical protein